MARAMGVSDGGSKRLRGFEEGGFWTSPGGSEEEGEGCTGLLWQEQPPRRLVANERTMNGRMVGGILIARAILACQHVAPEAPILPPPSSPLLLHDA
jgi:hypothetical protein